MSAEAVFMLVGFLLFIAALVVNAGGRRLLNEAKTQAERWEREHAAAMRYADEAKTHLKTVQALLEEVRRLQERSA